MLNHVGFPACVISRAMPSYSSGSESSSSSGSCSGSESESGSDGEREGGEGGRSHKMSEKAGKSRSERPVAKVVRPQHKGKAARRKSQGSGTGEDDVTLLTARHFC